MVCWYRGQNNLKHSFILNVPSWPCRTHHDHTKNNNTFLLSHLAQVECTSLQGKLCITTDLKQPCPNSPCIQQLSIIKLERVEAPFTAGHVEGPFTVGRAAFSQRRVPPP